MEVKTLYRGVAANHPAYQDAKNLLVSPRNSVNIVNVEDESSLLRNEIDSHNADFTVSGLTSWSDSLAVANYFACLSEPPGVVLIKRLTNELYQEIAFLSEDAFHECEVLLRGKIVADELADPECPGNPTCY